MTTEPSQLRKTAQAAIDGYNAWDIDAILAPRAPDCTQRVYPARLNRPAFTNERYREFFTNNVQPHFEDFRFEVLDVVEDERNNKVVIHARSSSAQTTIGEEYKNEYMFLLRMTEDHKQIVEIKEFIDSGYSVEFFTKLRGHW